ncbi:MAG: hypothetical protein NVS2B17_16790 [Candidatus Velthaea sp.]
MRRRYPPWGQLGPRAIAEWGMRTQASGVHVEGLENVPRRGPVMLIARHFHHLLDGAVILKYVRRPVHIIVGLDWAADAAQRRWMERACRAAEYPIVLRPPTLAASGSYDQTELVRYTRSAFRESTRLLVEGRVVLVFPEGYPTIDPTGSRKAGLDDWLPFANGYVKILELAKRAGVDASVVPVGFDYVQTAGAKWRITCRIGRALGAHLHDAAAVETAVRALSQRTLQMGVR